MSGCGSWVGKTIGLGMGFNVRKDSVEAQKLESQILKSNV